MKNRHIYKEWLALTDGIDQSIAIACFKEVEQQYRLPSRYYHTIQHVCELFKLIKASNISTIEKQILTQAALFHDVIYIPRAKNNELQSAKFATTWLQKLGIDKNKRASIYELIIATSHHTSDDLLTQLFLDMDLSILGSSPRKYKEYNISIRKEYSRIPLLLYKRGRKRFLQYTLDKTHIFYTENYRHIYEEQARINIQEELNAL